MAGVGAAAVPHALGLPAPPFELPANRSALWSHRRGGPAGGAAASRERAICVAVSLFGLPRTLSRTKLAEAWRAHLLEPLMPCVDTFLGFGFGAQKGGMQDGASCRSCLANSSGGPSDAAHWAPFGAAVAALRPMAAQHTWSYKRSAKQDLCVRMMGHVEAAVGAKYDWALVLRPDVLFSRPFPLAVLRRDERFHYMDFWFLVPSRAKYLRGWPRQLPRMISTGIKRDKPTEWELLGLPGARICREEVGWARQREALDEMWQSIGGERSAARLLALEAARGHAAEAVHRTASVFCLRYGEEAARGGWIRLDADRPPCAHDADGAAGREAGAMDEEQDDLFSRLASALEELPREPTPAGGAVRRIAKRLLEVGIRASFSSATNHSAAVQSFVCSCAAWERARRWPPKELADTAATLADAFSPHALECSDSVTPVESHRARRRFQAAATQRLEQVLALEPPRDDRHRRHRQPATAERAQPERAACQLYGELSIFCDVYRYQRDLLPTDDGGAPCGTTLGRFATHASRVVAKAPANSSCPCTAALRRMTSGWAGAEWEPTRGVAAYAQACDGMGLNDFFRLVVDTGPIPPPLPFTTAGDEQPRGQ